MPKSSAIIARRRVAAGNAEHDPAETGSASRQDLGPGNRVEHGPGRAGPTPGRAKGKQTPGQKRKPT